MRLWDWFLGCKLVEAKKPARKKRVLVKKAVKKVKKKATKKK